MNPRPFDPPDAPLNLIPWPKVVRRRPGSCVLSPRSVLRPRMDREPFCEDRVVRLLQAGLLETLGFELQLSDSEPPPGYAGVDIRFETHRGSDFHPHRIAIAPDGIVIAASQAPFTFPAIQTLRQLLRQFGPAVPAMEIQDVPDYRSRGVLLDVSRGKVPKLQTLLALVARLALLKFNRLQLYVEHVFDFKRHPQLCEGHDPLTANDISTLSKACHDVGMHLVPNLQTLGHASHILRHQRYRHMAESDFRGGWTLSPAVPEVYEFLSELFREYLPCFGDFCSELHVNADEPWDLGRGRSARLARELGGIGPLYVEHLRRLQALPEIKALAADHGLDFCFWADVLENHPQVLSQLPDNARPIYWCYDAHGKQRAYREALIRLGHDKRPVGVSPGTGAWLSSFFRKDNARVNLREMGRAGVIDASNGNVYPGGYLLTDWGDEGHYNFISQSYWSLAYGAECAWNAEPPDAAAEARFDERFLATQLPGAPKSWIPAIDTLGNMYQCFGPSCGLPNNQIRMMLSGEFFRDADNHPRIRFLYENEWPCPSEAEIRAALAALDAAEPALRPDSARPPLPAETELTRREWLAGIQWARIACARTLEFLRGTPPEPPLDRWRSDLLAWLPLMEELWLARNRPSDWPAEHAKLEALATRPAGKS